MSDSCWYPRSLEEEPLELRLRPGEGVLPSRCRPPPKRHEVSKVLGELKEAGNWNHDQNQPAGARMKGHPGVV